MVEVGPGTAHHLPVHHGQTGLQHFQHLVLGGLEGRARQDLAEAATDVTGFWDAVHRRQGRVDGHVPQLGVQDGQPDRRLGDQLAGQGDLALQLPQHAPVGGQAQGVVVAEVVRQPHVAELHHEAAAVLVPNGEGSRPAPAGHHHLGEQSDGRLPVFGAQQQVGRVLSDRFLTGVAEQLLGLRAPHVDPAVGLGEDSGDAEQVQQPAPAGRGIPRIPRRLRVLIHPAHRTRPFRLSASPRLSGRTHRIPAVRRHTFTLRHTAEDGQGTRRNNTLPRSLRRADAPA